MGDILISFFDLVPVGLFLAAAIMLQRDLYNKMSKGAFALFATGTITVFVAGFAKALHKILYFTAGLNFYSLYALFFPMQTVGFVIAAVGLIAMSVYSQGDNKVYSLSLPIVLYALIDFTAIPDDSKKITMFFVVMMCLGVLVMYGFLARFSLKMKSIPGLILLIVAFIGTLGMGYLASKEGMSELVKEAVNAIGQGSFLAATIVLRKQGLGKQDSLKGITK